MSKKKDKENQIICTFMGESRSGVTGSSVLLNIPKMDKSGRYNILIEMGLVQGGSTIEKDLANNRRMLERFNKDLISSIETVFVNHFHADHTCSLPYLASAFQGNIITTRETLPIMQHIIEDSVKIHTNSIQRLKESKGKKVTPFYTNQDMYRIFEKMEYREINTKYRLNDEIEYRFIDSGHVLGGAMLELWIKRPNQSIEHLVYSSDMGSNYNNEFQYCVPKRSVVGKCNHFISEATYNSPNRSWTHKQAVEERKQLKSDIKNYLCSGKEILMSSFSAGRLQNILCMLWEFYHEEDWFRDIPIIIDGVLLHKINSDYLRVLNGDDYTYFNRVMNWKNIKPNKTYDGTMAILSKREPRIIISTSGFLTNGRIVTYLQHMLGSSKCVFYATGYCGSEDSIAYKILNKDQKTVTIDKKVIVKRCETKQLKTFSSHIQYDELISLYKGLECEKIFIHHSDGDDKLEFAEKVREELRKIGKTTKIEVVSDKNNQFIL